MVEDCGIRVSADGGETWVSVPGVTEVTITYSTVDEEVGDDSTLPPCLEGMLWARLEADAVKAALGLWEPRVRWPAPDRAWPPYLRPRPTRFGLARAGHPLVRPARRRKIRRGLGLRNFRRPQ